MADVERTDRLGQRLTRQERGVISVLAAVSMVAVMMSAALAIDIGRLAWASRSLQGATDRAALDAVRVLGDLYDPNTDPTTAATAAATSSLSGNPDAGGDGSRTLVSVRVGDVDHAAGTFTEWAGGAAPTAVEVTTTTRVPFMFDLGVGGGGQDISRVAIAEVEAAAAIGIGTTLATISGDDSLVLDAVFGGMLGGSFNLGAVGYEGLVSADISLGELLGELGITAGTPTETLDTNVTVADLMTATASGLTNEGDPLEVAAITALATMSGSIDPTGSINLGDLFDMSLLDDVSDAEDLEVNVFDMISTTAQITNGTNFVDLGGPLTIPGVTDLDIGLQLIELPQIAVGPASWNATTSEWDTVASSAQTRLSIDLDLLGLLNLPGLLPTDVSLPLYLELGRGEAALTAVSCAGAGDPTVSVQTTTAAAGAWIGALADLTTDPLPSPSDYADILLAQIQVLLAEVDVLDLDARAELLVAQSIRTDTFTGPYQETFSGGGTSLALADLLDSGTLDVDATVLGALPLSVQDVVDELTAALVPILGLVDTAIQPVFDAFGLTLGAADTTVFDVECHGRKLVNLIP